MKVMIQNLRIVILLAMVMTGTKGFAQTSTDKQPVSSDQVLTRTPKKSQSERSLPVTSGCTELTRVRPSVKRNSINAEKREVPVGVERMKKD